MNTYTSVTKNSLLSTSIIPTMNRNEAACDLNYPPPEGGGIL